MPLKWVCVWVLTAASAAAQENSGSIAGTVVDATASVIPNADVMIVSPVQLETTADSVGNFLLANLAPGAYELRVQARGFVTKHLEIAVEAGEEKILGHVALDVKVPPCVGNARKPRIFETPLTSGGKTRVLGSARGEAQGALRNMTVTLLLPGTLKVIATTETDENGEFWFDDVIPGIYDLAISFGEGTFLGEETFAKVRNLRVRKGHELEVRLTWTQPPGQICL